MTIKLDQRFRELTGRLLATGEGRYPFARSGVDNCWHRVSVSIYYLDDVAKPKVHTACGRSWSLDDPRIEGTHPPLEEGRYCQHCAAQEPPWWQEDEVDEVDANDVTTLTRKARKTGENHRYGFWSHGGYAYHTLDIYWHEDAGRFFFKTPCKAYPKRVSKVADLERYGFVPCGSCWAIDTSLRDEADPKPWKVPSASTYQGYNLDVMKETTRRCYVGRLVKHWGDGMAWLEQSPRYPSWEDRRMYETYTYPTRLRPGEPHITRYAKGLFEMDRMDNGAS